MLNMIKVGVVTALALAGACLTLSPDASAAPAQRGFSAAEQAFFERASAPDTPRNAYGY